MPKTIPAPLLSVYMSRGSTITTCWKITRTDGIVRGFTSHSKDVEVLGLKYYSKTGYVPTAVSGSSSLSVDNMDVEGLARELDAIMFGPMITESDIRAGAYDYAEVQFFEVDYTSPGSGINILRKGNLGELTLKDGIHATEIRGLSQRLTRIFIRTFLPDCDAELYDARCGITNAGFTNTGDLATVVDPGLVYTVNISGTLRADGYFDDGLLTFTSGAASGRSFEILSHTAGPNLTFALRNPFPLLVGDTFEIQRGCDRKISTCINVFNNVINFRGFPKVPGNDLILKYPDSKQ